VKFSKIVSTVVLAAGMFAVAAPAAHAQDEKLGFGGGYQYMHISNGSEGINTNGFFLDVTGGLPQRTGPFSWAWTGELTGNYKDGHAYTYTGGGIGSWQMNPKVKPFIDVQLGGITEGGGEGNANSDSAFLLLLGGGAKIPLMGQKFDILVKLDYGRAFYSDTSEHAGGQNIFRLGIGASFPLPLR
jgi:hypothetical protein